MVKPSILEVTGQYVSLRRSGKEWAGCCPFHADKNPSFSVNEEKGLFHCFACGVGGDVIDFVMKIEGASFKEASIKLGLSNGEMPRTPKRDSARQAAAVLAAWARETSLRIGEALREIGDNERLARELNWAEQIERYEREWAILCDLQDDLFSASFLPEIYAQRKDIEALLNGLAV